MAVGLVVWKSEFAELAVFLDMTSYGCLPHSSSGNVV